MYKLGQLMTYCYMLQNINHITYHNYGHQSWKCFEVQSHSTSTNWYKINKRKKSDAIYLIVDGIIANKNGIGVNEDTGIAWFNILHSQTLITISENTQRYGSIIFQ